MRSKIPPKYEQDFYAWTLTNAKFLREGKLTEIDIANVAEEIESMGKSEKRELISRLAVLIAHLLKWQFQPARRNNSWKYTIEEQREEIIELLKESPSLKNKINQELARAYNRGVLIAATETDLGKEVFPKQCSFSLEKLINKKFFPA
jgi:hypothetical protein